MRRPDRNRASPAPPPRLCPRPARATSRPRPCCAAPDRPASRLRPTPRAPPAHLDSPDPALCPAPRAASQSSFSPSCPRLSRGRMFHVKHSSSRKPGTGRREGGLRGGARRRAERGIGRVEVRGRGAGSGAQAGRGPVGGGATGTRTRRGPGGARAEAGRRRRRSAVPVGATHRGRQKLAACVCFT